MRSAILAFSISCLAVIGAACSSSPPDPKFAPTEVTLPGPENAAPLIAPTDEPEPLAGVKTDDLTPRERKSWWRFVSELYAPCSSEAVSIATCVKENRSCAACVPAAKLIVDKVKEGATNEQLRALYGMRFGPNVKSVDLQGSPAMGPADAPVVIVEYFDFECPHCRLTLPVLERVAKKYPSEVRLVKKFYPLRQHTHAEAAARAAIAAANQGKYWEMERRIFEEQSTLEDGSFDTFAKALGLDMNRYKADLGSAATEAMLKRDHDEAEKNGLTGTPFILINGREFDLAFFHFESDLDPWIELEATMKRAAPKGPPPLLPRN